MTLETPTEPKQVVAILGGAVAGSEAAALFASRGILTIVFEQNPRPYGKIEDGLPRWHTALRKSEYEKIGENLTQPGVLFVPNTTIGEHIAFDDVAKHWGLSALVLANGAWRDRPLAVPGVDEYIDKGLVYQNPFVYWYNHYPEKSYAGQRYEIVDDAIVVGGGLASIDVVKIISLELFERALRARGIETDMHDLERRGINKVLEANELTKEQLGIKGCTLFYRRNKHNMPLAEFPKGASDEKKAKVEKVRAKIMDIVSRKFFVRFEACHVPHAPLVEDGRMVGLRFRRSEIRDGRVHVLDESTERDVRSPLTISSIGSVPKAIEGLAMKRELYPFANWDTGELEGYTGVFGLGNVLTGKGNIKASRVNAKEIGESVLVSYLGLGDEPDRGAAAQDMLDEAHEAARRDAEPVVERAAAQHRVEPDAIAAILRRVEARWNEVGYTGDYRAWIEKVTPPDLQ